MESTKIPHCRNNYKIKLKIVETEVGNVPNTHDRSLP